METERAPLDAAHGRWRTLLAAQHPDPAEVDAVFADLVRRLHAPGRWHHDLQRLTGVLHWIDRLEHRAHEPRTVRLTAWVATAGEDVVHGGERAGSARWAARSLPRVGVGPAVLCDVERLLTGVLKDHDPADDDADGQVLCDADLAVLGAGATDYRAHVDALRRESGLPEAAWREHRRATVHELLRRVSVFHTPEMRAAREGRAQLNIAREAAALRAAVSATEY